MLPVGVLDVETVNGQFRWTYETVGGSMWLGPTLYKSKSAARNAGKKWLVEQEVDLP
jgi:hypothetical protein